MPPEEPVYEQIAIISAILIMVAAFVVSAILYFTRRKSNLLAENRNMREAFQHQLLQSRIEVQEATFSSLGRELHDNIGQLLGTAKMLIGVSQRNPGASADSIRTADETLSKAIQELRSLSKTLNREWLEQFDFKENLQSEAARINQGGVLTLAVNDEFGNLQLSSEQQIILFRIVQEAIQNAMKHSGADQLTVMLKQGNDVVTISIADNGRGMTCDPENANGIGLMNMKNRVSLLQGKIEWQSNNHGTKVFIEIPNDHAQ